ncbi:MAG: YlxR family protein [Clostridia bacterium]|nr:YlxR family protein [Clostridia bacterium]
MNILKSIPQRTCIGCNSKKDKNELIRIVKDKQNNISIDKTGKANGRGAYICDSIECLEKAIKNKRIEKSFEMKIDEIVYENLRSVIGGK